jgi:N6-adenosine-specific RNA methylase IME4
MLYSMKKYRTIIADPPWDYRNGGNGRAASHYPLMTIDELCQMDVKSLAADDSVLLLWSTWPQVVGAMRVISAWGFEYVTGFPWVKLREHPYVDMFGDTVLRPTWGTGAWVRGCSEPIFICKRGKQSPPDAHFMGLVSKRMQHSRKPNNLHEYAESFPGPYLELFARRERPGWDVFGNEVETKTSITSALTGCQKTGTGYA